MRDGSSVTRVDPGLLRIQLIARTLGDAFDRAAVVNVADAFAQFADVIEDFVVGEAEHVVNPGGDVGLVGAGEGRKRRLPLGGVEHVVPMRMAVLRPTAGHVAGGCADFEQCRSRKRDGLLLCRRILLKRGRGERFNGGAELDGAGKCLGLNRPDRAAVIAGRDRPAAQGEDAGRAAECRGVILCRQRRRQVISRRPSRVVGTGDGGE